MVDGVFVPAAGWDASGNPFVLKGQMEPVGVVALFGQKRPGRGNIVQQRQSVLRAAHLPGRQEHCLRLSEPFAKRFAARSSAGRWLEPPRVCRRLISVRYAAMDSVSQVA